MYPVLGYSWELKMPEGVQIIDGADAIRKAVREQVKFGADWIKFYADRKYFMKDGALHSKVNFTAEEAKAMVDESHRLDRRVAAHAMGKEGIAAALAAGVDTIEHGNGLDEELMDRMIAEGVYWCPTIYVGVWVADGRGKLWQEMRDLEAEGVRPGGQEGGQDRLRDRRGRLPLDREPGERVRLHGQVRDDPDAGDPLGHPRRRRIAPGRRRHGNHRTR